jgi:hypothetical protein
VNKRVMQHSNGRPKLRSAGAGHHSGSVSNASRGCVGAPWASHPQSPLLPPMSPAPVMIESSRPQMPYAAEGYNKGGRFSECLSSRKREDWFVPRFTRYSKEGQAFSSKLGQTDGLGWGRRWDLNPGSRWLSPCMFPLSLSS